MPRRSNWDRSDNLPQTRHSYFSNTHENQQKPRLPKRKYVAKRIEPKFAGHVVSVTKEEVNGMNSNFCVIHFINWNAQKLPPGYMQINVKQPNFYSNDKTVINIVNKAIDKVTLLINEQHSRNIQN